MDLNVISRPLISFEKTFPGKNKILKIKQFGHNGTNYNAEITNFFEIDDDLNLNRILSLESKCFYPKKEGMYVLRGIKQNSDSIIEVVVELQVDKYRKKAEIVAKGHLEKRGRRYFLTKKYVSANEFEGCILNSNKDDTEFLESGYGYFDYPCCDKNNQ